MSTQVGSDGRGHMDISHQKETWARFGQMVKWSIIVSAIIAIVATYAVYVSHY